MREKNAYSIAHSFGLQHGILVNNHGFMLELIQCPPVAVKFRQINSCYHDLPVSLDGEAWFLEGKTHILKSDSTEILCKKCPIFKLFGWYYTACPGFEKYMGPVSASYPYIPGWENPWRKNVEVI